MRFAIALALAHLAVVGCATTTATTQAEDLSGYTYVPLDPFPVRFKRPNVEEVRLAKTTDKILELFPDHAVRMSLEQIDLTGNARYGPAAFEAQAGFYRVVTDYINSDTASFEIWIKAEALDEVTGEWGPVDRSTRESGASRPHRKYRYVVDGERPSEEGGFRRYTIPIYVGVGLRVTAQVSTEGGRLMADLGVLGAEAEANRLSGSLVIQSLGINGRPIGSAIPIQSELNRTTVQNALVSIGAMKALIYDESNVKATPRTVGMYLPFEVDRALLNAIISELADGVLVWSVPDDGDGGLNDFSVKLNLQD